MPIASVQDMVIGEMVIEEIRGTLLTEAGEFRPEVEVDTDTYADQSVFVSFLADIRENALRNELMADPLLEQWCQQIYMKQSKRLSRL